MTLFRKVTLLAAAQLFLAVVIVLALGVSAILQGRQIQFYSAYAAKFTPVDEDGAARGPFGYTSASFARVVHSNAEQHSSHVTVVSLLSIVLALISVFQLRLARSALTHREWGD